MTVPPSGVRADVSSRTQVGQGVSNLDEMSFSMTFLPLDNMSSWPRLTQFTISMALLASFSPSGQKKASNVFSPTGYTAQSSEYI